MQASSVQVVLQHHALLMVLLAMSALLDIIAKWELPHRNNVQWVISLIILETIMSVTVSPALQANIAQG